MEINNEIDNNDKQKALLKRFVDLLIDCEKDFEVEAWGSGEGLDIKISSMVLSNEMAGNLIIPYKTIISIKNNGYVSFDLDEETENIIIIDKLKQEETE